MKYLLFTASVCLILILVAGAWAAGDPDLVIYFSFDKFTNVVPDESGKGHNGTVVGDVKPDAGGKRSGAAKFAKGSYLDLDGAKFPVADVPVDAITLCAWAKPENTGDHHAIFNARAADQTWVVHPEFRSNGVLRWLLRAAGSTGIFDIQTGKWEAGQWYHFGGVYSAANKLGILYLNGEKIGEAPGGAKIAGDWAMGARVGYNIDNARPFTGLMDDFCLWKRALSQDEIKAVMTGGPLKPASVPDGNTLSTTWGRIKELR